LAAAAIIGGLHTGIPEKTLAEETIGSS
jgi:hypothetical protein